MNTSISEIKAAHEHSKAGTFLFNLSARGTEFLVKHRWLYYLLACTWGIVMTTIGLVCTAILGIVKAVADLVKPGKLKINFNKYHWIYSISVGPALWGGCDLGLMFLRDHESKGDLNEHEFGHTFQNCIFGPLFPFIVAIPSATRWWMRVLKPNKEYKPYDSAWFEDAATQCGMYAHKYLSNK